MRILHLIYSFNTGGAERMVIALANSQITHHQVGLCIINDLYCPDLLSELDNRIGLFRVDRKKGSRNVCDVLLLNWYILKFHPDILHVHDSDAILYVPIRRLYRSLLTIHAACLPLKGIGLYDRTVAISKAVAHATEARGFSLPQVIYNGVPTSAIRQLSKAERTWKEFRIVQVGRLEHTVKGQHLLLEVLDGLAYPYVTVDFIGSGSSEAWLGERTRELRLEKKVNFLGNRSSGWIYRHLCEYQLLVQPSLDEGFGLTIAEGMAAGVPVLVSNLPGPMEVIGEGKYGYSFASNDINDFRRKLEHIIAHYEEARQRASEANSHVVAQCDFERIAGQYVDMYNRMLEER